MAIGMDKVFMATDDGENIYYVDYNTQTQNKIGISQKVADELANALASAVAKRDEYRAMLEAAGILEKEKTPEELAKEAAAAAIAVQKNYDALKQDTDALRKQFQALLERLGETGGTDGRSATD